MFTIVFSGLNGFRKIKNNEELFMKGFNKLLKVLIFLGLLSLLIVIFSQKVQLSSSDLGRHLENGKVVWRNHQVLFTNFYSYTKTDFPFINHHWFSGVIFYGLYLLGGFKMLSVFNILLILFIFIFVFNWSCRNIGFYASALLSVLIIFLLSERVEIRPEMFSYLFIILTWFVIERVGVNKKYRQLLYLLPLFILWVSLHIYFIIGLALLGFKLSAEFLSGFFIHSGKIKEKLLSAKIKAKPWFKSFIYLSLASLLNPNTWRGLLYPFRILHNYGYEIVENKSVFYLEHLLINYNFIIFKFLLLLLFLSFIFYYLINRKINLFHLFLALFFSALALFASRNLALFALTGFILISYNLAPYLNWRPKCYSSFLTPHGDFYVGIILMILLISSFVYLITDYNNQSNFIRLEPGWGISSNSLAAVRFFKDNKLEGPILNNYDLGGLLIFSLYPQEKVFVDNRPEAYGKQFFDTIYKPLQSNPKDWKKIEKEYKFKSIFFSHLDSTPWAQKFLRYIVTDQDWSLVYFDNYSLILINKKLNSPDMVNKLKLRDETIRLRLRYLADHSDSKSNLRLASLAQLIGEQDIAGEIYQKLLFKKPNNRQVLTSLASFEASKNNVKDWRQSLVYFKEALAAGNKLPTIYDQIALVEWNLQAYKKAEINWKLALSLDKNDVSALYYLKQIEVLKKQGKLPLSL